jgi:hypothetical protein
MTQYLLQFYNQTSIDPENPPGRLIKIYEISEEQPILGNIPGDRDQMIIDDTELYNDIINAYQSYPGNPAELIFTYDLQAKTVTW